ncbi:BMC domain-containing protein, partial [Aeromonas hydrophila]|uniref:BMC domain-containing protein n=1 Tax=Aeromonas hydrophila TaxID=644 RepID=UPI003BC787BA
MKSLGVIETRGLVAAIQAVDAACKAAGVSCIGYRKVGSGLVSVCFEGEISAIHTAIERGVAVAATIDQQVHSLVIARPEPSAVAALGNLKGYPPRAQGEIVNILLKIKNSFLPTKQILIGL